MPFSPHLFDGRVWASEPKRGDIAVFKLPKDGSTDYIKRVIGLPGDRIQMINGVLHINGKATERQRIEDYQTVNVFGSPAVAHYRETLPGGVSHEIIELEGDTGIRDNTQVYVVPAGHFFMMGDNRDNSTDSRDPDVLRSVRELCRPGGDHLLLHRRRRVALAHLGMAPEHPLEPHVPVHPKVARRKVQPDDLQRRLGYDLQILPLPIRALTHVSAPKATRQLSRLEFLGTACSVSRSPRCSTPPIRPGRRTSRRLSELVRRETCAEVALAWDLAFNLGAGEVQSGGRRNQAILADVCEAIIGAVLDGGYPAAKALVAPSAPCCRRRDGPCATPRAHFRNGLKAGAGLRRATRSWSGRSGSRAAVPGDRPGQGDRERARGRTSKRAAEQEAARNLLLREGLWTEDENGLA